MPQRLKIEFVVDETTGETGTVTPYPQYMLDYVDSEGEITRRPIFIIDSRRDGTFDAYCFIRKDVRTFREGAVIELAHIQKKEPITDRIAEIRRWRRVVR